MKKTILIVLLVSVVPLFICNAMKRKASHDADLVTPAKRTRQGEHAEAVSPQKVMLDAENCARSMLQKLKMGNVNEAYDSFFTWYSGFPGVLEKIRWATPLQDKDEAQLEFKAKLSGAVFYSMLLCLLNCSRIEGNFLLPVFEEQADEYVSKAVLGSWKITTRVPKTVGRARSIEFDEIDGEPVAPVCVSGSIIKKPFYDYIFEDGHNQELQESLQNILEAIPDALKVSKEQFYHTLLYGFIRFMGSSFSMMEVCTGQGRADIILIGEKDPRKNRSSEKMCAIIELKFNGTADQALNQILSRSYEKYFSGTSVQAIGINISHKPFRVTCLKRKIIYERPALSTGGALHSALLPDWF